MRGVLVTGVILGILLSPLGFLLSIFRPTLEDEDAPQQAAN
jgi:hypothetical protein